MTQAAATDALFDMLSSVAPALVDLTRVHVVDELWNRPGLAPRERALVTVAVLVARNATLAYPHYFNKALDSGVSADAMSEVLTHLGPYASLANAFGAISAAREVLRQRGLQVDLQAVAAPSLLALEDVVPPSLQEAVFGISEMAASSPALAHFTGAVLQRTIWCRPGLPARERVLVTLAALAALGQTERFPGYLALATHHGLRSEQLGEALAHVAFYGGWGLAQKAAAALRPAR